MNLQKQFEKHWQHHKFPSKEKQILIATSGGKDSMSLAFLMLHSGYNIALAHCNFQLRGNESDLDEQLVTDWAKANNIVLHKVHFDTQKAMIESKKGVQETARELRYDWFKTLLKDHNYAALATAHHANDNAETLLINLCKGTGIAGLHGIPAKNGSIIRPLLFASRNEIDEFAAAQNISYREDASNTSTKYLRNAVRHKLLPVLNEIFPDVVSRLNDNIGRFIQVENIYKTAIESKMKKLIEKRGADYYIPILKLQKETELETICFEMLSEFGFTTPQIPEILKLFQSESGHYISSLTHKIIRNRNFLIVTELDLQKTDLILIENFEEQIETENGNFSFTISEKKEITEAVNIALIDFKKLSLPLILRRWKTGDYFYPIGMGMKKKKVGRFLIDQKIPLHLKEKVWILESDKKIIWVTGLRMDERFKIKPTTEKVLEIHFLNK